MRDGEEKESGEEKEEEEKRRGSGNGNYGLEFRNLKLNIEWCMREVVHGGSSNY